MKYSGNKFDNCLAIACTAVLIALSMVGCAIAENQDTISEEETEAEGDLLQTLSTSLQEMGYNMDKTASPTKTDVSEKLWIDEKMDGLKHLTDVSKQFYDCSLFRLTYKDESIPITATVKNMCDTFNVTVSSTQLVPTNIQTYGLRVCNEEGVIINQSGAININDVYTKTEDCNIGSLEGSVEYLQYINREDYDSEIDVIEINGIDFGDTKEDIYSKLEIDKTELERVYTEYLNKSDSYSEIERVYDMYSHSEEEAESVSGNWFVKFVYYVQNSGSVYTKIELEFNGNKEGLYQYKLDCTPYTEEGFKEIYKNISAG